MNKDNFKKELEQWLIEEGATPSAAELAAAEAALVKFAEAGSVVPQLGSKAAVLSKISALNAHQRDQEAYPLHQLPLLDAKANLFAWRATVAHITPPEAYENIHMHELESNDDRDLFLVFVRELVPEEVHYDILESFLLLDGSCTCIIKAPDGTERKVHMSAGDYIEMQLGEHHDVFITSSTPAKAILQWKKLKLSGRVVG
jgi:mannose-6-phosphate isomerase-like protein (cupin superfamily)